MAWMHLEEFYAKIDSINSGLPDEFKDEYFSSAITRYDSPEVAIFKQFSWMKAYFTRCNYKMSVWLALAVDRNRLTPVVARKIATDVQTVFNEYLKDSEYVKARPKKNTPPVDSQCLMSDV